jgi:hypothetical protein
VSASAGDWTGDPTSTGFQWERCSSTGSACSPISGATASSYVPVQADVGVTLQARVTATSTGGSATSASPPSMVVRPGSTTTQAFGVTTVGPNSDSMVADRKRVNVATLGVSASVTSLTMYLAPTTTPGSQSLTGVIYADASGAPGALLARTSGLTFTSQSAAGWYSLPLASPVALSPGRYWIGVQSGGTSGVTGFRWTSAASSRALSTDAASDGPSNPFGPATIDAELMSVYASYR